MIVERERGVSVGREGESKNGEREVGERMGEWGEREDAKVGRKREGARAGREMECKRGKTGSESGENEGMRVGRESV